MIISNINTMRKYLPSIISSTTLDVFEDALQVAEDSLTDKVLGDDLKNLIEGNLHSESRDHEQLIKLVERVICNLAFLNSIPEIDLILTSSGFAVTSADEYTPASRQRVDTLISTLNNKVNDGIDALVKFLACSKKYAEWRGSEQFNYISSGIILSYSEFCHHAKITQASVKNWNEFYLIIPSLYSSLYQDVAPYLSSDYIDELIEKVRDNEIFTANGIKVLNLIKDAICASVSEDTELSREKIFSALQIMKANPALFPTFTASDEVKKIDIAREDTPIYSML